MTRRPRKSRPTGPAPAKSPVDREARLHATADAFLESELMEETAAYLLRGRRFSALAADALNREWTVAFKSWAAGDRAAAQPRLDDLSAELRLRKLEPPYDTVAAETAALQDELRRLDPNDPRLTEKIGAFLRSRDTAN
jgi:hypothetical protein